MKYIYIHNADEVETINNSGMQSKSVVVSGESVVVSDGDHTMDELYEHRYRLFLALGRLYDKLPGGKIRSQVDGTQHVKSKVWRTLTHSDGTPTYKRYFLMGIGYDEGEQISYHLPMRLWEEASFAETLEKGPEFDGHTSLHVAMRLMEL